MVVVDGDGVVDGDDVVDGGVVVVRGVVVHAVVCGGGINNGRDNCHFAIILGCGGSSDGVMLVVIEGCQFCQVGSVRC